MTANNGANRHRATMERARARAREHGSLASPPGRDYLAEAIRRLRRRGRLTPAELVELTRLGFSLNPRADKWRAAHEYLAAYQAANGHADVTARYVADDGFRLGVWAHWQKQRARRGIMADWQRAELTKLGFALPDPA